MIELKNLTEPELKQLAFALGAKYKKSDLVIGLTGRLGAGKTTFAKSFAKALGIRRVKSPTFIVVSEYQLPKRKFFHIDFYRLSKLDQLQALGLTDILASRSRIALIEWVDKFPSIQKQCDLVIKLSINNNNTRHVQVHTP